MVRFRGTLSNGYESHPVQGAIAHHTGDREFWTGTLFLTDGAEAAAGGGYRLDVDDGVSVDVVLVRTEWTDLDPEREVQEAAFRSTGVRRGPR